MEHHILNFDLLATNNLRLDALSIAEAGYGAIHTESAIMRKVHIENDELHIGDAVFQIEGRRIFFVGVGKCSIAAATAIEKILGDRVTAGIALDVANENNHKLSKIEICIGTHPLPSETNVEATEKIIKMLEEATTDDLVLLFISGGGSTLLCQPEAPMRSADEKELFTALTESGATIQELNTVRKHTSRARGGWLAKAAKRAQVVSLIVSDVPGNDIAFISSGPTVKDTSTIDDAKSILDKYEIKTPSNCVFIETPKEDIYFERVTNILFITNQDALLEMQREATKRGYTATIMNDRFSGEARSIGRDIIETLHTMPSKTVLLYAGESTVTLKSYENAGGRNQEMALSVLPDIRPNELLLAFASDGHDNTDHAGAISDTATLYTAMEKGISVEDSLEKHCSYDFFKTTGDALLTGYTESNVSDIIIAIKN